jgi:hypothetical protein
MSPDAILSMQSSRGEPTCDGGKLVPLEESEIDGLEASVVNLPHGGALDRLIADEVERLGFTCDEVVEIMGPDPYAER